MIPRACINDENMLVCSGSGKKEIHLEWKQVNGKGCRSNYITYELED
jgi:type VI protein secretion system component Hcp